MGTPQRGRSVTHERDTTDRTRMSIDDLKKKSSFGIISER